MLRKLNPFSRRRRKDQRLCRDVMIKSSVTKGTMSPTYIGFGLIMYLNNLWQCYTVFAQVSETSVVPMSSLFPLARPSRVLRAFHQIRWNSTEVAPKSATTSKKRPHLGIQVDPNHGLWAFFRKKEVDGVVKYETLEAKESLTESGSSCRSTVWACTHSV